MTIALVVVAKSPKGLFIRRGFYDMKGVLLRYEGGSREI